MPAPSLWTWPGPQDGLGQGGLRLKWAKGRFWSKIDEKMKVLGMEFFSTVENLSGPQESIFCLSRRPQLHFGKQKSQNWSNCIKCIDFPLFPLFGVDAGINEPGLGLKWAKGRF